MTQGYEVLIESSQECFLSSAPNPKALTTNERVLSSLAQIKNGSGHSAIGIISSIPVHITIFDLRGRKKIFVGAL